MLSVSATFLGAPTTGVPAVAPEALMRPDDLVVALAGFLADVHALGTGTVEESADHRLDALARAAQRVESNVIDAAAFDAPYAGQSPERLVMIATDLHQRIAPSTAVVVHGALDMNQLSLSEGRVCDWPALAELRFGDRYADLSFLARDLARVVGPQCVPALFDAYGLERPDPLAVEFWVTLRQVL